MRHVFFEMALMGTGILKGPFTDTKDYNLLIKPHLYSYYLEKFGDIDLRPQLKILHKLASDFEHVKLIIESKKGSISISLKALKSKINGNSNHLENIIIKTTTMAIQGSF